MMGWGHLVLWVVVGIWLSTLQRRVEKLEQLAMAQDALNDFDANGGASLDDVRAEIGTKQ